MGIWRKGITMDEQFDLICIGLGPAGMAVSLMGSAMGLKVCAIEKHRLGGECMNVGCIPSKALLQIAKTRYSFTQLTDMGLGAVPGPAPVNPFEVIQKHLEYISEKKTKGMFSQVQVILGEGSARFVGPRTVAVGERRLHAKRIYVCVGTRPQILPVEGIESVPYLTNENLFSLDRVPSSLIVLGGGAIACEMAQAFARLGSRVTLVQRSPRILSRGEPSAAELLERVLQDEQVRVLTGHKPVAARKTASGGVALTTDRGETVEAEQILLATGRSHDYGALDLDKAGVTVNARGQIEVDGRLRTKNRAVYAVGDCNGHALFSHAAMHQGMVALMNSLAPWPFRLDYRRYVVPYTVFTTPPISHVGLHEAEIKEKGLKYETVEAQYGDYGAAIAEHVAEGYIKAFVSPAGRVYGVDIVGEGSGDMINEWALVVQKRIRIHDVMLLQHSFPTMGFLSKRVAETWAMGKMRAPWLHRVIRRLW